MKIYQKTRSKGMIKNLTWLWTTEIISKLLLVGGKFLPKMHLRQPGLDKTVLLSNISGRSSKQIEIF